MYLKCKAPHQCRQVFCLDWLSPRWRSAGWSHRLVPDSSCSHSSRGYTGSAGCSTLGTWHKGEENLVLTYRQITWNDVWCPAKMREFTLRHNVQRHLGHSEEWIFWVWLVTCTCNVWCNEVSHHFNISSSFDTLIDWDLHGIYVCFPFTKHQNDWLMVYHGLSICRKLGNWEMGWMFLSACNWYQTNC